MQISTTTLLNTLNTKSTKELRQKGTIVSSNESQIPLHVEAKNKSIGDLIESLFKTVASDTKTKESILNTLKSSDIPKNIQNPVNELKELVKQTGEQKVFEKYVPKLEKYLVDIKQIDTTNLKEQIKNSGSFLESKLNVAEKPQILLPQEIQNTLKKLQTILKSSMGETPKTQTLINDIKTFIQALKTNPHVDKGLINDIKNVFVSLKSDLTLDKQIVQALTKYENLFKDTKNTDLQKAIQHVKSELITHTNKILSNEKIAQTIQNIQIALKNETPATKEFLKDVQAIIAKVKSLPSLEQPILKSIATLESFMKDAKLIESKIINDTPLVSKEVEKLNLELKSTLLDLKSVVTESKGIVANIAPKSIDTITKLIDVILNQTKLFAKEPQTLQATSNQSNLLTQDTQSALKGTEFFQTTKNLTNLIENIKVELKNIDIKQPNALEIVKALNHLEQALQKEVELLKTVPFQKLDIIKNLKQEIATDIKAVLLQMKEEALSSTSVKARESIAQIDKVLNSVEYYQLNSYLTNTTNIYLPFLWQGLEKGEVSFKRLKEDRFFCEINLSLKEYGKIDLMVMLYEDNHINLSVFAQKKEFIEIFKDNMKDLRIGLNKLGLIPSSMHFYDALKDEKLRKQTQEFISDTQIDMGINIQI